MVCLVIFWAFADLQAQSCRSASNDKHYQLVIVPCPMAAKGKITVYRWGKNETGEGCHEEIRLRCSDLTENKQITLFNRNTIRLSGRTGTGFWLSEEQTEDDVTQLFASFKAEVNAETDVDIFETIISLIEVKKNDGKTESETQSVEISLLFGSVHFDFEEQTKVLIPGAASFGKKFKLSLVKNKAIYVANTGEHEEYTVIPNHYPDDQNLIQISNTFEKNRQFLFKKNPSSSTVPIRIAF